VRGFLTLEDGHTKVKKKGYPPMEKLKRTWLTAFAPDRSWRNTQMCGVPPSIGGRRKAAEQRACGTHRGEGNGREGWAPEFLNRNPSKKPVEGRRRQNRKK